MTDKIETIPGKTTQLGWGDMEHRPEMSAGDARARVAVLEAELAELRKRVVVPEGLQACALIMRGLSLCEPEEIDSDDAEIWLEDESGRDGEYSFSITEQAGKCADILDAVLAAAPAPAEMSKQQSDWREAISDAVTTGGGFVLGGARVSPEQVFDMPRGSAEPVERVEQEPAATVEVMPDQSQVWVALKTQWLPVGLHKLYTTPQPAAPAPDVAGLVEALRQIVRWDGFPSTGQTWPGTDRPISYSAAYGSNGERDFMRNVAADALAAYQRKEGE